MFIENQSVVLPPHAFPLGNISLEQTKFYLSLKGLQYPSVLAGFRDQHTANAQISVLTKLKGSANICVVCDSRGQENFEAANLGFNQPIDVKNPLICLSELVSDVDFILTSKLGYSAIELAIMMNLERNILEGVVKRPKIIVAEDYSHSFPLLQLLLGHSC